MKNARKNYFATPVPEKELRDRVNNACNTSEENRSSTPKLLLKAAGLLVIVVFVILVRTSPGFAAAAASVPGLGKVVRLINSKPHVEQKPYCELRISTPQIAGSPNPKLEKAINEEINKKIALEVEASQQRAQEYIEARIATGTPAEEAGSVPIIIDSKAYYADETHLSFEISKYENIGSAYNEDTFYNIDFVTGKSLKLTDILPENDMESINAEIRRQIQERIKNDENAMFFEEGEMGGFKTISPDQNFYIDTACQVVIVFAKYEIAPGSMGRQTFTLPFPVKFPEAGATSKAKLN